MKRLTSILLAASLAGLGFVSTNNLDYLDRKSLKDKLPHRPNASEFLESQIEDLNRNLLRGAVHVAEELKDSDLFSSLGITNTPSPGRSLVLKPSRINYGFELLSIGTNGIMDSINLGPVKYETVLDYIVKGVEAITGVKLNITLEPLPPVSYDENNSSEDNNLP